MSHLLELPMRVLWQNLRPQGALGEAHAEAHWRARHRDPRIQEARARVQEVAVPPVRLARMGGPQVLPQRSIRVQL